MNLETPLMIRTLQRKLYCKAKVEPAFRFCLLYGLRADRFARATALLTKEPLSIQVHPDDAFAQSIRLANGKTEASYILSATPGATIAVGLKRPLAAPQLQASIEDGSTTPWRLQKRGRLIANPFRGAFPMPEPCSSPARISYLRGSTSRRNRTWIFMQGTRPGSLSSKGRALVGLRNAFVGEAIFLEADRTSFRVGSDGLRGLLAYVGPEQSPSVLHNLDGQNAASPIRHCSRLPLHQRATAGSPIRSTEARP
jgi:hypothetical protein